VSFKKTQQVKLKYIIIIIINRARKRVEVSFKKTQQEKLRIKMSGDVAPELRKDKVP